MHQRNDELIKLPKKIRIRKRKILLMIKELTRLYLFILGKAILLSFSSVQTRKLKSKIFAQVVFIE